MELDVPGDHLRESSIANLNSESRRRIRLSINLQGFSSDHFGNQSAGGGSQTEAQHIVSGGEVSVLEIGGWTDDGKAVPSHGSPAVPSDLGFAIDGGDEIGAGGVAELLDSGGRNGGIKAGKLHHGAESETVFKWGNTNLVFRERDGMGRAILGALHGYGVAFAGLNGDLALQLL